MPSLLLHVDDACWVPDDQAALVHLLTDLGFAGDACERGCAEIFWPGRRFLESVMFLGCSPQVSHHSQQSGEGQPVCRLLLRRHTDVQFLSAVPRPAVRCPCCKTRVEVAENALHDSISVCPGCSQSSVMSRLDWRQGAGFGRFFIEISGIFPHEAVPSDKLLDALCNFSGVRWHYFYR